jgi:hypothetical protein
VRRAQPRHTLRLDFGATSISAGGQTLARELPKNGDLPKYAFTHWRH